jgi:tRNA threonylcarbamoyl adenosine modification protein YeaZ
MAPHLTLAIESSNPGATPEAPGSVALARCAGPGDAVELLGEVALAPRGRHDDALMPSIEALLRRCDVSARDLERVAVSTGPGGYTSVRIGVTTAKMIGEAVGAMCVGVPTAACAATGSGLAGVALVALASKREQAWCALVACDEVSRMTGAGMYDAASIEVLLATRPVAMIADAHLPQAMRAAVEGAGVRVVAPRLTGRACAEASRVFTPVDPVALAPLYPREPEAVSKWRELRGT